MIHVHQQLDRIRFQDMLMKRGAIESRGLEDCDLNSFSSKIVSLYIFNPVEWDGNKKKSL